MTHSILRQQQRWESTVEENLSAHLVSGDKEENVESVLSMRDDCGNLKYDKANRFTQGVLCAVLVGLLNGSFMLPLKFANKVSFSICSACHDLQNKTLPAIKTAALAMYLVHQMI